MWTTHKQRRLAHILTDRRLYLNTAVLLVGVSLAATVLRESRIQHSASSIQHLE